jgi:hypothetical protein
MTDYAYVLLKKYPNSLWELSGNEYENLIWKSDDTKPTQKQLDDLAPIVKAEQAKADANKQAARQAVLDKLGLTADEITALLG